MNIIAKHLIADFRKGTAMKSPMMKFRGLKFLTILACVMTVYAVAVAESGYYPHLAWRPSWTRRPCRRTSGIGRCWLPASTTEIFVHSVLATG